MVNQYQSSTSLRHNFQIAREEFAVEMPKLTRVERLSLFFAAAAIALAETCDAAVERNHQGAALNLAERIYVQVDHITDLNGNHNGPG